MMDMEWEGEEDHKAREKERFEELKVGFFRKWLDRHVVLLSWASYLLSPVPL